MTPSAVLRALVALGVLCVPSVHAEVITWDDCVALALRQNPELAAARYSREAGRADYLGSYNGVLPRLSLSNSVTDSNTRTASTNRWSASATASLDLFNAAKFASIRTSKAGFDRAAAELRLTSTDLRLSLRRAFLQLLSAQENLETSRRIAEMRARGSELVTLRYDSGRESRGNMLRAQAQRQQAEADLAQAARELRIAQRTLDRRLGGSDFTAYAATGTLATGRAPELPSDSAGLAASRPDVLVQEASIRSAEASLSSARSSLWPTLSASYTRSVADRSEFPRANPAWSAAGTLSLPVFGSGPTATYFDVSGARAGLSRAREDLRRARDAAVVDIEGAWSDFARTTAQAGVQASLLEAARQRNQEADVRYASGLLSYDNWEIISTDRINQERQELQARVNAAISEASWERALGRGLGE
ncbi:MAG: TolC family protein [Elusimicrobia bacterium]|nr:TolC family protein [Elusimicrobiota bacterium]